MTIQHFAKMIERMEDLILTGVGIPFTPWTLVHGERLVPLLDKIREMLPEEIQQAQKVLYQREEIIVEAQKKANQLLQEAKRQAEGLLSESELLKALETEALRMKKYMSTEIEMNRKQAEEEIEMMKAKAREEAIKIRQGADDYAEEVLEAVEQDLDSLQTAVRQGQRYLKKIQMDALQHQSHSNQRSEVNYHVLPQPTQELEPNRKALPESIIEPQLSVDEHVQRRRKAQAQSEKQRAREEFLKQTSIH